MDFGQNWPKDRAATRSGIHQNLGRDENESMILAFGSWGRPEGFLCLILHKGGAAELLEVARVYEHTTEESLESERDISKIARAYACGSFSFGGEKRPVYCMYEW